MNARETKELLNEEQKAWVDAIRDTVDQQGSEFESIDEVLQWINGAAGEPEEEWARENAGFLLNVGSSLPCPNCGCLTQDEYVTERYNGVAIEYIPVKFCVYCKESFKHCKVLDMIDLLTAN